MKGAMKLPIVEQGKPKTINILEGQFFLLPARTPHSPQRPEPGSIGMVIERDRQKGKEMDCLRYFVDGSDANQVQLESWFYCENLESLGGVIKSLSPLLSEGVIQGPSSTRHFEDDKSISVHEPFTLNDWVDEHKAELETMGFATMFNTRQTRVIVYNRGTYIKEEEHETFFFGKLVGLRSFLPEVSNGNWKKRTCSFSSLHLSTFKLIKINPIRPYLSQSNSRWL